MVFEIDCLRSVALEIRVREETDSAGLGSIGRDFVGDAADCDGERGPEGHLAETGWKANFHGMHLA